MMEPMKILVVAMLALPAGCQIISADPPPYAGPLWGDACLTDKGPNTISGCVHYDDGTADPAWDSQAELGLCAPPSAATMDAMPSVLRSSGYTGACRPFCDRDKVANKWTCPADGVPTYEAHGLASGLGFCYCADAAVDDVPSARLANG